MSLKALERVQSVEAVLEVQEPPPSLCQPFIIQVTACSRRMGSLNSNTLNITPGNKIFLAKEKNNFKCDCQAI